MPCMFAAMTKRLKRAFEEAAALSPKEQNALAKRILDEIEILSDEAKWDASFARMSSSLERMAKEALDDVGAGRVCPMFDRRGRLTMARRFRHRPRA